MTARTDLSAHLAALDLPQGLVETLTVAAAACVEIKAVVAGGALVGALGASGAVNVQDEEQKKLDVMTNDMLTEALLASPAVAGVASEEMDEVQPASNPAGTTSSSWTNCGKPYAPAPAWSTGSTPSPASTGNTGSAPP